MKFIQILVISLSVFSAFAVQAQVKQRFIAITIDDLPVVSQRTDIETRQKITTDILKHLTEAKVPAIGFVNENKLYTENKRDEIEVNLLRQWLDAGLELGNHTFSHNSLGRVSLEEYENDVLRGEIITKELLSAKGLQMRYFRHPFLITGKTLEIKQKFGEFLLTHGYTIAPVTIDNDDPIFAGKLDTAVANGDKKLIERIGLAYVPFLEKRTDYWERQSVKLFGREIKQILLIHANSINAKYLGDVLKMFKTRGYTFITLKEALKDEAYKLPDTETGSQGVLWLYRWALDRGKKYVLPNEPPFPRWILKN
jgi:peptidoglycan/xylan/chitin deacetylase (PgdA/CDA1 family)